MLLDIISRSKINEFLTGHYKEISHSTIRGAIENHIFERYRIENYKDITHQDYLRLCTDFKNNEIDKTAFTNCEYFIKYLYANGELHNVIGFQNEWLIKDVLLHFEGSRNRLKGIYKTAKKTTKRNILNILELSRIKQFLEINTENEETYKTQFSWYLLFDIGLGVTEIKSIKLKDDYDSGILSLPTGEKIKVPRKFHIQLENHRKTAHDSFSAVNIWMDRLGESLEIGIPLKPITIKNTREKLLIECSNCQREFLRDIDSWVAISGWIVCKNCAEELKKKEIIDDIDLVDDLEIDTDFKINKQLYISYNELKKQLLETSIDYLKLHELQMAIGDLGEQYVYEYELDKLEGTKFADLVDKSKAKDNSNGYDILSYTREGKRIHIEVKTTSTLKDEFYISQPELDVAEQMKNNGEMYKVYFVKDILGVPQLTIIDNVLDEIVFRKIGQSWKMIKE